VSNSLCVHTYFLSVQSLASPAYLHYLATSKTEEGRPLLFDPKFKAFLRYLQTTWSRPEYARFITYPHSLYFLDLLIKNETFCRELAQVNFRNFCHQQQYVLASATSHTTLTNSKGRSHLGRMLVFCVLMQVLCMAESLHDALWSWRTKSTFGQYWRGGAIRKPRVIINDGL
jgi:SOH1